ncbi:hypothetical protein ABPG74_018905, partial [Tetrahymena malaccensis]
LDRQVTDRQIDSMCEGVENQLFEDLISIMKLNQKQEVNFKSIIEEDNTKQNKKEDERNKEDFSFFIVFFNQLLLLRSVSNKIEEQYLRVEFNSIIYINYNGLTMFSTLDKQGKIQNSYQLDNNYQTDNQNLQAYFVNNTKIYLTDSRLTYYYIIDFNKIGSGKVSDYFFQKTYTFITYACPNSLMMKIGPVFYSICYVQYNGNNNYVIWAPTFDSLFTSTNILYSNQTNPPNHLVYRDKFFQFIVMGYTIFMDDGNQYYINQTTSFQILSKQYNLCLINNYLCKMQFQGKQLIINQSQYNINTQSNIIELQNKPFVVAYYNSKFTIFDVEKLQIANTQGDALQNTKFFQYQNFLFFQNYYQELQYIPENDAIQVIQKPLTQNIQQFNIPSPFFSYGFSFFLYSGCYAIQSHQCFGYLNSIQKLYQMIPGCQQYSDNQMSSCLQCQPKYYMQNGICVTNCQESYFQKGNDCLPCQQNCQNCNGGLPTDCLKCKIGFYQFQDNSCGACDTSATTNAYLISGDKCECQNGFMYFNQTCTTKQNTTQQQQQQNYQSEIFTQSLVQSFTQQSQVSSQVTYATTTILSSIQNMVSSSNYGVVINGLTCLKLSYLTLVDTDLPDQIYKPLSSIINQCPNKSFKNLNAFALIGEKYLNIYFNEKYQSVDYSYVILHTSGSAFFLFIICCFLLELDCDRSIVYSFLANLCDNYSLLWLSQYIQYFILSSYSQKSDINNYVKTVDSVSYSFLINMQFILLYLTFHMMIELLVKLYEFIKQKIKQKQVKEDNNKIDQNLISQNNSSSNQLIANQNLQMVKIEDSNLQFSEKHENTNDNHQKIQLQEQKHFIEEIKNEIHNV